MKATIDKAGRLVIPKKLREQFQLRPDAAIEILPEHDGLRLRVHRGGGQFIEKEGILVERADMVSQVDATEFINRQRVQHALGAIDEKG